MNQPNDREFRTNLRPSCRARLLRKGRRAFLYTKLSNFRLKRPGQEGQGASSLFMSALLRQWNFPNFTIQAGQPRAFAHLGAAPRLL